MKRNVLAAAAVLAGCMVTANVQMAMAEDITVDDITITNEAEVKITEAKFMTAEEALESTGETEIAAEAEAEEAEGQVLVLTAEDGTTHLFEGIDPETLEAPVLTEADTFLFLTDTDENGEKETFYETAEEIELEKPETRYIVNMVNVRALPDSSSDITAVAQLGGEVTVVGVLPKWIHVEQEDMTGFIARSYVSGSEEDAEAALNEENAARAAQAAAQAAAAQAASSQAAAPAAVYEVSREAVDDCDGSGHGYYIITYSDGSTGTENY